MKERKRLTFLIKKSEGKDWVLFIMHCRFYITFDFNRMNIPSPGGYTTLLAFPSDVLSAPQGNILFQPFLLVDAWEFGRSSCNTIFVCKVGTNRTVAARYCHDRRQRNLGEATAMRSSYVKRKAGQWRLVIAATDKGIWAKLLQYDLCM